MSTLPFGALSCVGGQKPLFLSISAVAVIKYLTIQHSERKAQHTLEAIILIHLSARAHIKFHQLSTLRSRKPGRRQSSEKDDSRDRNRARVKSEKSGLAKMIRWHGDDVEQKEFSLKFPMSTSRKRKPKSGFFKYSFDSLSASARSLLF